MTAQPLTKAQATTLRTIVANGGEMNGYAGQPGFYCNSKTPLKRLGLVESIECDGCREHGWHASKCQRPLPGRGGNACYDRMRITEAGQQALAAHEG